MVAYLPKPLQPVWRAKLQQAYRQPTYAAAHAILERLHGELRRLNEDAARSLAEGLEETLTLHRLGLADRLGISLTTTNGLESILALVEQHVGKVDRGRPVIRSSGGWRQRCWSSNRGCAACAAIVRCCN